MAGYQDTFAWQQAIELSHHLQEVTEELPAEEKVSLGNLLRDSMVEIPATVALDIIQKSEPSWAPVLRLETKLQVISRIYPAIDLGAAEQALKALMELMKSAESLNQTSMPAPQEPEPSQEVSSSDNLGE
jgi:hypothetical protein